MEKEDDGHPFTFEVMEVLIPLNFRPPTNLEQFKDQSIHKSTSKNLKLLYYFLALLMQLCVMFFPLYWRRQVSDGSWDYLDTLFPISGSCLISFSLILSPLGCIKRPAPSHKYTKKKWIFKKAPSKIQLGSLRNQGFVLCSCNAFYSSWIIVIWLF